MQPSYSFLSKPPLPPQKKLPLSPPPPTPSARKRSSTFSAIAAWAAHVQPGSPGSPHFALRRSSLSRSPATASLFVADSPDHREFKINLTDLGYTSVFVPLSTPSPLNMSSKVNPDAFPVPPTRTRPTALKRLRSLSILRPRSQTIATVTTTLPPSPTPTESESPKIIAASIAKRKKAVYAYLKSSSKFQLELKPSKPKTKQKTDIPPSLAAELALMQFADGGSTEANVKRLMEARARAAAPAGTSPTPQVVGDVYRDAKGGIWLDREEEMEYVHLLGGHDASGVLGPEKWVSFGGEVKEGGAEDEENEEEEEEERGLALASIATDADAVYGRGRRGSANSIASSVNPCNIIQPAEEDAKLVQVPFIPPSVPAAEKRHPRPALDPILTIPSRPRHAQHHLQASPNFFLLDVNAFSVPHTPAMSTYPSTTITSRHPKRGAARRRPAPLNIVAHVPMRGVSPDHEADEKVVEEARKDFLEASFKPAPALKPKPTPAPKYEVEEVEMVKPVKMHREAVYRVSANVRVDLNVNGPGVGIGKESGKSVRKKASMHLLSLFGRK